jgi:hypothetical protein
MEIVTAHGNRGHRRHIGIARLTRQICGMQSSRFSRTIATLALTAASLAYASAVAAQATPTRTSSSIVRVTLQLESDSTVHFDVDGFELKVSPSGMPGVNAEMQLVKQAGINTAILMAMAGRHLHAPSAVVEVLDSAGTAAMTFRLSDVTVVSHRLTLAGNRATLEQQSISQQEALSALNADYQEAARQLATNEELNRNHVGTRLDLARARDRVSDLQRRVDLLKQRQAQVLRQLAGSGLEETIILHFAQVEVESKDAGGRAVLPSVFR